MQRPIESPDQLITERKTLLTLIGTYRHGDGLRSALGRPFGNASGYRLHWNRGEGWKLFPSPVRFTVGRSMLRFPFEEGALHGHRPSRCFPVVEKGPLAGEIVHSLHP